MTRPRQIVSPLAAVVAALCWLVGCGDTHEPATSEPGTGATSGDGGSEMSQNGGNADASSGATGASTNGTTAAPVEPDFGRFKVTKDGTALDPSSGLTWQRQHVEAPMTWSAARAYCTTLDLAGGGFHLPTMDELKSMVEWEFGWYGAARPEVFPGTPPAWFWSSSVAAREGYETLPSAGRLSFADESGTTEYRSDIRTESYVRCVRETEPKAGRFEKQADGTVKDTRTALSWQPFSPDLMWTQGEDVAQCTKTHCTHELARLTCASLAAGGPGWRLPTVSELLSLLDARYNPGVEPALIEGSEEPFFSPEVWSSEIVTPESIAEAARVVSLESLTVSPYYTDTFASVLCVR